LFQAKAGGSTQPITIRPDVMHHPNNHGFIVCSYRKISGDESDFNDKLVQSIYGIWITVIGLYVKGKKWSDDDNKEYVGASTAAALNS